jgi:hypothetical protein
MARPRKIHCRRFGRRRRAASSRGGKKRSFHQELVLNRWVLGFFQGGTLSGAEDALGR